MIPIMTKADSSIELRRMNRVLGKRNVFSTSSLLVEKNRCLGASSLVVLSPACWAICWWSSPVALSVGRWF